MTRAPAWGDLSLVRGELRKLRGGVSIPNAICFSPDGRLAYFADTAARPSGRQALDDGWPAAEAEVFLDLTRHGPASRWRGDRRSGPVLERPLGQRRRGLPRPDGQVLHRLHLPPAQTCPAFIGPGLTGCWSPAPPRA